MFRFKCGKELGRIACAEFMIDAEIAAEILDDSIYRLAIFEQLPDPGAAFIQLQVNPIFDMKQESLFADGCGYDLRRSREDGVSFGHRFELTGDQNSAISIRV